MAEYRLFDAVTGGARENDPDALTGVSLGTEFYVTNSGRSAMRLWYWHPVGTGDTAQRVGRIYRVTDQTVIAASVTFPVGTSGTWVSVDLPAPVPLTANERYVLVIWHPNGHFALTTNYWTTNRIVNDLIGPENADAHSGGQCTYDYSTSIQYPTSTFASSNYWGDVTVTDTSGATAEIGTAPEADTAQPLSSTKTRSTQPADEADTAGALAAAKTRGLAAADSTESAHALAVAKAAGLGPAGTAEAAHAVVYRRVYHLGTAAAADTADTLATAKHSTLGLAVEEDTAQPVTFLAGTGLGAAGEADAAHAIRPVKTVALATADETCTAWPVTATGGEQPPEDVDYAIGAPRAGWTVGQAAARWTTGEAVGRWKVGTPWI